MTTGLMPEFGLQTNNLIAPGGTRLMFNQAAAPLGWTIDTSLTDHFAYIQQSGGGVNVTGGSGAGNFLVGNWNSGSTAISVAQMPAHNHVINIVDGGHTHTGQVGTGGGTGYPVAQPSGQTIGNIGTSTTGITANSNNNGSGGGHSHPMGQTWNYATHMIAQKS